MNWFLHDPDEYETVTTSVQYGFYPGTTIPFGSSGISRRRRKPDEIAKIKDERLRKEEDETLKSAAEILQRRAQA